MSEEQPNPPGLWRSGFGNNRLRVGACANDEMAQQTTADLALQPAEGSPSEMAAEFRLAGLKQDRMQNW